MNALHIQVPENFVARNCHQLWFQIEDIQNSEARVELPALLFDMTKLKAFDAHGANLLVLVPHLLQARGHNVKVLLPKLDKVLFLMDQVGILREFASRFSIEKGWGFTFDRLQDRKREILGGLHEYHFFKYAYPSMRFQALSLLDPKWVGGRFTGNGRKFMRETEDWARDLTRGIPNSLRTIESGRQAAQCLSELVLNVFEHSTETTACATVQIFGDKHRGGEKKLLLAVSDVGVGIHATLRAEYNRYRRLCLDQSDLPRDPEDVELLKYAVQPGVSRRGPWFGGMGLHYASAFPTAFTLSSGNSSLHVTGRPRREREGIIVLEEGVECPDVWVRDMKGEVSRRYVSGTHAIAVWSVR